MFVFFRIGGDLTIEEVSTLPSKSCFCFQLLLFCVKLKQYWSKEYIHRTENGRLCSPTLYHPLLLPMQTFLLTIQMRLPGTKINIMVDTVLLEKRGGGEGVCTSNMPVVTRDRPGCSMALKLSLFTIHNIKMYLFEEQT